MWSHGTSTFDANGGAFLTNDGSLMYLNVTLDSLES